MFMSLMLYKWYLPSTSYHHLIRMSVKFGKLYNIFFINWKMQHVFAVSCKVRKRTFEGSNQPAQSKRVFVVRMKNRCIFGNSSCAQGRLWSDCANAQADLSRRWAHIFKGNFPDVSAHFIDTYCRYWFWMPVSIANSRVRRYQITK